MNEIAAAYAVTLLSFNKDGDLKAMEEALGKGLQMIQMVATIIAVTYALFVVSALVFVYLVVRRRNMKAKEERAALSRP